MAEVQTTYSESIARGLPGMIANGETGNRISRTCEVAAGIGFGVPVYRGSSDEGCTNVVGTLATFLGWTINHAALGLLAGQDADEYAQYESIPILTLGAIYINIKGAITDGAAVTVGAGAGLADLYGATAADATHIATGWVADETVTDAICRVVRR